MQVKHYLVNKALSVTGIVATVLLATVSSYCQSESFRIMYYNLLDFPYSQPGREIHLRTVNQYLHADVILVNELKSSEGANLILNNALNVFGVSYYQKANYIAADFSENLIYYNSTKFGLHSQYTIYTSLRDINEYVLYFKSADLATTNDTIFFYFYVAHLKANQEFEQDRLNEVNAFLNRLNSLPNPENVFFGGDLNFYSDTEPAYQALIDFPAIPLHDPLPAGIWHNNYSFRYIHTQSTRTEDFGGGATGGMDDRFDFILFSGDVLSGDRGVSYVPNSCIGFGNDGNHFNDALIDLPLNPELPDSVTYALYYMSDHLPVVADFLVEAGTGNSPTSLVITEIMYNPPESGLDSLEFIEVYNNSQEPVNLAGYSFSFGVEYTFPSYILNPASFAVVAVNSVAMMNTFGINCLQWSSGGLNNGGELIVLNNALGATIDSVWYMDVQPWPLKADAGGSSLVICNPQSDNSLGYNWSAASNYFSVNASGDSIFCTPGFTDCPYPPIASFTADQVNIHTGQSILFTDFSLNNPTSWQWIFEGGTPATSGMQNPVVTYNTVGNFQVKLLVSNASGSDELIRAGYIQVSESYVPGTVIITEIMQNPSGVTDANGEWFELFNPTPEPIDLIGWTVRDDGTDVHEINLSVIVPAYGFAVLGINGDSSVNGGYVTSYQYSDFFLGNGADEIILLNEYDTEIDRVEYDGGPNWPDPNGSSMIFTGDAQTNNNLFGNWAVTTVREPTYLGSTGDKGSPGTKGTGQNLQIPQPVINLQLKVFLEGPFQSEEMSTLIVETTSFPAAQPFNQSPWFYFGSESVETVPNNDIVDWVLLELRVASDISQALQTNSIARQACFLLSDGSVVGLDGNSLPQFNVAIENNLFSIVRHRNHLAVISANPLEFIAGNYTFDFTTGEGQAYGNGQKEISPGIWGMMAGDTDGSGQIDLLDLNSSWAVDAGKKGYYPGDLNLDNQVNNADKNEFLLINLWESSLVPQ